MALLLVSVMEGEVLCNVPRPMTVSNSEVSVGQKNRMQQNGKVSNPQESTDSLATPISTRNSTPGPRAASKDDTNTAEFSDDSDDELQDWSLLNNFSKKGMKDLEPLLNVTDMSHMSAYDQSKLNKARNMRFNALAVKRGSIVNLENLKVSTIYIDTENHSDLFMLQPKGKFLETMGVIDNQNICHFGFEEVLYLVERGSCMLKFWDRSDMDKNGIYENMPPLSLQAAYSILIKNEEQLNQYLVYSILKRDGYIITRNEEFDGKISERKTRLVASQEELFQNIRMSWWTRLLARMSGVFNIQFPYKLAFSYFNIFTYLRSTILQQSTSKLPKLENGDGASAGVKDYKISFNVWKPSPNFKKKNPPPPDYQLTVFKATQKLPKYAELQSLLERTNSNPDTYKPKPKNRPKNNPARATNVQPEGDSAKGTGRLEKSWNYAKGIDLGNLKFDPRRITLAIVDNVTVNFITLSHCSFVSEGPVWRDHWVTWRPPQKKHKGPRAKNKGKPNTEKNSNTNKNPKNLTVKTTPDSGDKSDGAMDQSHENPSKEAPQNASIKNAHRSHSDIPTSAHF